MSCSFFTVFTLLLTSLAHKCYSPSHLITLYFNLPLAVFWIVTVSLLGWNLTDSITTSCATIIWGSRDGVVACRLLKALFAFTVTGAASACAAVVLDIVMRTRQSKRGNYNMMRGTDDKDMIKGQRNDMKTMKARDRGQE
jgi:hypothetical protein